MHTLTRLLAMAPIDGATKFTKFLSHELLWAPAARAQRTKLGRPPAAPELEFRMLYEHKHAKRWTALLFSSSKPKPSELQLRKGALLRRTPRPCLAQAPLPLPISLASRISAAAPFFKDPLAGPLV